jgi:hypothetical protein
MTHGTSRPKNDNRPFLLLLPCWQATPTLIFDTEPNPEPGPNQQHPRTSLTPVFLTGTRLARLNRSGDHENKKLDRQGKATTMRNPWHDILDID